MQTSSPSSIAPPISDERRQVVLVAMAHGARLLRFAARYAPTLQDAEDAYQRAMIIALTKAPTTEPSEFMAWLHTVLRNEALAIARNQAREGPAPSDDVADTAAETLEAPLNVDAVAAWRERYRALHDALEGLTDAQKICLILQCAGESYAGIQAITGYSLRKIERSVLEGRRALRLWQVELIEGAVCERIAPLIEGVVDGEAGRRERRRVSKHVAHCGACRARLRSRREMRAGLAGLAPVPLLADIGIPVPDPSPVLAWWERVSQGAVVHTGQASQMVADLSGSGVARIGAGAAAVALAGVAGVPLVVDAVDGLDRDAAPAAVRPAVATAAPQRVAVPTSTPARTVRVAPARARAAVRARADAVTAPRPSRPRPATRTPPPRPATVAPPPPAPVVPSPVPASTGAPSRPAAPPASSVILEFGP